MSYTKPLAKLTEDLFSPPLIFTLLTHPKFGAKTARAVFQRAKEGGLDLNGVWDGDEDADQIDGDARQHHPANPEFGDEPRGRE